MKEQSGRILHFAGENRPVAGCTVSEQICHENGTGLSEHSATAEKPFKMVLLLVLG